MSDQNDNFNIDDILAEFGSYSDGISGKQDAPDTDNSKAPRTESIKQSEVSEDATRYALPKQNYSRPVPHNIQSRSYYDEAEDEVIAKHPKRRKPVPIPKAERKLRSTEVTEYDPDEPHKRGGRSERAKTASGPLRVVISVVFAFITLLTFVWIAGNVHPDSGTVTASTAQKNTNLLSRLDMYMNNAKSEALGDLAYIKKVYTIPETDTVAPKPNEAAFGVTTDMSIVQGVVDAAAELLDGQELVWNSNLDFYPDSNVYYYRDATILALVWREKINNRSCTIAEVKVADGSQFRRKLSEDTYGSSVQNYCSTLANAANAVVAMNADFYGFRQIGVTVYNRQLFRFSPDKLDNCFINSKGDMLFMKAGSIADPIQMQQYIDANDVLFSLSFGPILVDNGELQRCESYPIGEINLEYSRAGIGMVDDLHYLGMTVNHCNGQNPRCNVNEFAELMYSKGCYKAYNLDGGQTSEIVFHGVPINYIDFNAERTVTDIIYFATALPESEVSQ